MHLSALRVMQAGTDGAVEEGGVLKDTPAADGALTGLHAANATGQAQHGQVYTPLSLPCCLMLLVAGIMGPVHLYSIVM